jgi:NAD(P)-dependent dehydrogenase (short-subunit alcohol dehydrogenase family)
MNATTASKVVLITGALTGIGRATAIAFAREGNRVVVSGRRDDAGNALRAALAYDPGHDEARLDLIELLLFSIARLRDVRP